MPCLPSGDMHAMHAATFRIEAMAIVHVAVLAVLGLHHEMNHNNESKDR